MSIDYGCIIWNFEYRACQSSHRGRFIFNVTTLMRKQSHCIGCIRSPSTSELYLDLSPGSATQTLKMMYQQLFKTMSALFLFCYVVKTAFNCPKSDWNNYMSGKKLQEFPIKFFDTMGLNSCYKECKAHGKCLSINFNRKLFVCELLSEKKSEAKPLADDQDSVYMEITEIVRSLLFLFWKLLSENFCFWRVFLFLFLDILCNEFAYLQILRLQLAFIDTFNLPKKYKVVFGACSIWNMSFELW